MATICLQKFVSVPRNELVERFVKYVADVRRINEPVRVARNPLAKRTRENSNQGAAKKLILPC
jgi:hypothetical protein